MWEDYFEVHWISVLESQEFRMGQGQKVLTGASGSLIRPNGSLRLPASLSRLGYP